MTKPEEAKEQAEAAKSKAVEPVTTKDLTAKGPGVPDSDGVGPAVPDVENLALSTPRPDVPVAVSVVGAQNAHQPPDLEEFDRQGRPRT